MIPVKKTTRYIFTFSFIQPLNISGEGGGPYDKKEKKASTITLIWETELEQCWKTEMGHLPFAKGAKSFRERGGTLLLRYSVTWFFGEIIFFNHSDCTVS